MGKFGENSVNQSLAFDKKNDSLFIQSKRKKSKVNKTVLDQQHSFDLGSNLLRAETESAYNKNIVSS